MELTSEERLIVVEALREKATNLSGFSGKVGSQRGAEALARLEACVKQIKDLADRFEVSHCHNRDSRRMEMIKLEAFCPKCGDPLEVFGDDSCGIPDEVGTECDCGAIPIWKLKSWIEYELGPFSHYEREERMEKCHGCKQYKSSAMRRPDLGRVLCSDCYLPALRANTPTGLVQVLAYLRAKVAR